MTDAFNRGAESPLGTSPCVVVFDRRSVEFLPPYQLALQIAKSADTLVVDGAVPWRRWTALPLGRRVGSRAVAGGRLRTYTPFLLPERHGLARWTDLLNLRRMRAELARLTAGHRPMAVIFDSIRQLPLVGTLGEAASAYYLYDDFGVDLTGREHGGLDRRAEHAMLAAVDVVFAVSQRLCDYAAPHARAVHYLPNGFNADLFHATARPDADHGRGPVVGLAGSISGRVDLVGLHRTAVERPGWTFRILGGVSPDIERELEHTGRPRDLFARLVALPNVEYVAPRPLADVPAVAARFDVGMVPYCLNPFTLASSPLKAYEYYALGVPVVSTRIPEVMRFDPGILTVEEGDSYAPAIEQVLAAEDRDPRLRAARTARVAPHSTLARAHEALGRLLPAVPRMPA